MKHIFFCFLFFLIGLVVKAQAPTLNNNTIKIKDLGAVKGKAIISSEAQEALNTWIEIYELPNYQGKMVKFTQSKEAPTFPFILDRISIKKGSANFKVVVKETIGNEISVANDMPDLRVNNGGLKEITFTLPEYIAIYEKPNFVGKVKRFEVYEDEILASKEFDQPNLPFYSNQISIKLSNPSLIAYIYKASNEFPLVFGGAETSIPINSSISKIRFGKKMKLRVNFNGFLAEIHNNDCKRVRGWVKYSIIEKDRDNRTVLTPEFANLTTAFDERSTTFVPNNLYDINKFWLESRDGNNEQLVNRKYASGKYSIGADSRLDAVSATTKEFIVDEVALANNRVYLTVYTKLESAHKGCDLCSDYNENTGMLAESKLLFLLDANAGVTTKRTKANGRSSGYLLQPGPYRINGNGPNHVTYLQFEWMVFRGIY